MEQDKHKEEKAISFVTKASVAYCDKFPLRSAIQAIPGLGGALDTMLAGLGANYQYKRLEDFIADLNKRLSHVEQLVNIEPSEPLFDFMRQIFDQVIRTRSEEKRKRFANLIANQVVKQCDWNEAETACRLLGDLSDIHLKVLSTFLEERQNNLANALTISDQFSDETKFDKDKRKRGRFPDLRTHFPSLSQSVLLMVCSELVSKGLLYDSGLARFGVGAMKIFEATALAQWLMDWISDSIHR